MTPASPTSAKAILSCDFCRRRKIRCSRERPTCSSCTKNGRSCIYSATTDDLIGASRATARAAGLRSRIARLEELVKQSQQQSFQGATSHAEGQNQQALVPAVFSEDHAAAESSRTFNSNESTPSAHSTTLAQVLVPAVVPEDHSAAEPDRVFNSDKYTPPAHWSALAQELHSLGEDLDNEQKDLVTGSNAAHAHSMFSDMLTPGTSSAHTSIESIIQAFPPRQVADRLINVYFNSNDDPSVHILHKTSFQRAYLAFWNAPYDGSLEFVAVIALAFTLALQFSERSGLTPADVLGSDAGSADNYRSMASSAIALSGCINARRPGRYACQALILMISSLFLKKPQEIELACHMTSAVIRLAYHRGLHRDPSRYPRVSVFEAEMQRRIWSYIVLLDVTLAFHSGLPRIIQESQYDTELPSNLYDDDFDENSSILPISRPMTEVTPNLYLITKVRMASILGRILDNANSAKRTSFDVLFNLDAQLQQAYEAVPPAFRMGPSGHGLLDPSFIRIHRYNFKLLYLKARCVLHRRSLSAALRRELRAATSRRICIESALEVLHYQGELHEEIQPGGSFYAERSLVTYFLTSDFLFASMIVCVEAFLQQQESRLEGFVPPSNDLPSVATMITVLEKSCSILDAWRSHSEEAGKVADILALSLGKHKGGQLSAAASHPPKQHLIDQGQITEFNLPCTFEPSTNLFTSLNDQAFDNSFEEFLNFPTMENLDNLDMSDTNMFDSWIFNSAVGS